jgi:hypothetical protein
MRHKLPINLYIWHSHYECYTTYKLMWIPISPFSSDLNEFTDFLVTTLIEDKRVWIYTHNLILIWEYRIQIGTNMISNSGGSVMKLMNRVGPSPMDWAVHRFTKTRRMIRGSNCQNVSYESGAHAKQNRIFIGVKSIYKGLLPKQHIKYKEVAVWLIFKDFTPRTPPCSPLVEHRGHCKGSKASKDPVRCCSIVAGCERLP